MVLFIKLVKICCSWFGLFLIWDCLILVRFNISFKFFFWVFIVMDLVNLFNNLCKLKFSFFSLSLLAFILEKFNILLSKFNRDFVLVFVIVILCVWLVFRLGCNNKFNIFSILFMGVLILWFIVVRNLFLVWLVVFVVFFVLMSVCFVWWCCLDVIILLINVVSDIINVSFDFD